MNRHILFLVAIALAGALLVPTGAFPFTGPTDDVSENITLAPADSPDGTYAYLDQNDELAIDISPSNPSADVEGVNLDSVTRFDDVFLIHYNGSRFAHVWVTSGSDAVTFHTRGGQINSESRNVTLGPNGTVSVGMTVDTTDGVTEIGGEDFTVHAKVADPEDVGETEPSTEDGTENLEALGDGGDDGENDVTDDGDGETTSDGGDDGDGDVGGDGDTDGDGTGAAADGDGGAGGDGGDGGADESDQGGEEADAQGEVIQQPFIPLSEQTFGGFVVRTLLLLVLFVVAGAGVSAVTRRGLQLTESE